MDIRIPEPVCISNAMKFTNLINVCGLIDMVGGWKRSWRDAVDVYGESSSDPRPLPFFIRQVSSREETEREGEDRSAEITKIRSINVIS